MKKKEKYLAIGYSSKCNLNCSHCLVRPIFKKEKKMTLKELKNIIKSAKKEGFEGISFTFGEPTLYLNDLLSAISLAREINLKVNLITNSSFATNQKNSDEFIISLKKSGLSSIRISYSRFHYKFVKPKNLVNMINSCTRLGLKHFVTYDTDYSQKDKPLIIMLGKLGIHPKLSRISFYGNAKKLFPKKIKITDTQLTPIVMPNLDVYACCGAGIYFDNTNFFRVGNLKKERFHALVKKINNNRLYEQLETQGLIKLALKCGYTKQQVSNLNQCELCEKIFNNKQNLRRLVEFYS